MCSFNEVQNISQLFFIQRQLSVATNTLNTSTGKAKQKAPITNTQTPIQNAAAFLEIEREGINYF
jgi:hypothetical protein